MLKKMKSWPKTNVQSSLPGENIGGYKEIRTGKVCWLRRLSILTMTRIASHCCGTSERSDTKFLYNFSFFPPLASKLWLLRKQRKPGSTTAPTFHFTLGPWGYPGLESVITICLYCSDVTLKEWLLTRTDFKMIWNDWFVSLLPEHAEILINLEI